MPFGLTGGLVRIAIRSSKLDYIFQFGPLILAENLLLSKIFAFGWFGMPAYGFLAVQFFYILDAIAGCSMYVSYFFHRDELKVYRSLDGFRAIRNGDPNAQSFREFLRLGSLTFTESSMNYGFWFWLTLQSKSFGLASQTAFSLALQLLLVCLHQWQVFYFLMCWPTH